MKRTQLLFIMVVVISLVAGAQTANQTAPQKPTPAPQNAQPNAQQAPEAAPQPQVGRPVPEAKTTEEYEDYLKYRNGVGNDPQKAGPGADEFASYYQNSALRELAYNNAMMKAQEAGNAEQAIIYARKVLSVTPGEPIASMVLATDLLQTMRDTDLDRDQKLAEAGTAASNAVNNIDTLMMHAANEDPKITAQRKNLVLTNAYIALAQVANAKKDYASAETNWRNAAKANGEPDPYVLLQLALSLDRLNKYPEAMDAASKALQAAPAGSLYKKQAQQEIDRLAQKIGSAH